MILDNESQLIYNDKRVEQFFLYISEPLGIQITQLWQWYLYLLILMALTALLLYLFYLPLIKRKTANGR